MTLSIVERLRHERAHIRSGAAGEAADTIEGLYEALEGFVSAYGRRDLRTSQLLPVEQQFSDVAYGMRALTKARGEQ